MHALYLAVPLLSKVYDCRRLEGSEFESTVSHWSMFLADY